MSQLVENLVQALRAGNRKAINDTARRCLERNVTLGAQWMSVARALAINGEISVALDAGARALRETSPTAQLQFAMAQLLVECGRPGEAGKLVEKVEPHALPAGQWAHFLGTHAMEAGRFSEARRYFDEVVDQLPGAGASWLSLAALPPRDDAVLLDRLEAAAPAMENAHPSHHAQWRYARGTVLHRLGDHPKAFKAFLAGAELIAPSRPYDAERDRRYAESRDATSDRAVLSRLSRPRNRHTGRAVIVTGLPRSGTTLVEHILASHSHIGGGGEMPFGSIISREVGGGTPAALESYLAHKDIDELSELYLHLAIERFGTDLSFIDKSLGSSRTLGVLAAILPDARIVWLRRQPLDCAWSCFRTYFAQGVQWSWSLEDIARYFQVEDALYAHWCDVLGDRILTVPYEELTADSDDWIDRILAHVGLPHETAVRTAHLNDRIVTTSSVAQVREPVNRKAVGAAEPYRRFMSAFTEVYRPS